MLWSTSGVLGKPVDAMVMDRPWPEPSTHCPATAAQLFHSLPQNVPKEQPEAISRAALCSLPAEELFRGWLQMGEVRALTGRSRGSRPCDQPSECVCKPHLVGSPGSSDRRARRWWQRRQQCAAARVTSNIASERQIRARTSVTGRCCCCGSNPRNKLVPHPLPGWP